MPFYVYIVANKRSGTLYIGMTDNLVRRVWEHREGVVDGFTKHMASSRSSGSKSTAHATWPLPVNGR